MLGERDLKRISKFMSLVMRHEPRKIGVDALEPGGYVPVEALLEGMRRHGIQVGRDELEQVVQESDKQRFSFDYTGTRIRCNQGHSVEVDLQLNPAEPPERLFHGTTTEALPLIKVEGLKKMGRHAVHLSPDDQTAKIVGGRRGAPVVLVVRAKAMHDGGYTFYCSDNGVWLVDSVPADFIEFPSIFEGSAESRIGRRT